MKNILITGGAGFIGSEISKQLSLKNKNVVVLDNFSVGKRASITKYASKIYTGDIRNYELVCKIIQENEIEAIIHLAAVHYIPYCNEHPCEVMDVNVTGTSQILLAANKMGVSRLLFASSAAVYKPKVGPHSEADLVAPVDIYGISKKLCEEYIRSYCEIHGIKYTIMRLFNVCGKGDLTPHLIPEIINQSKAGQTITLGNTRTKRDYIRKEDVATAFVKALNNRRSFNQIFNVGTGRSTKVLDIFKMVKKLNKDDLYLKIKCCKKRQQDRIDLVADPNKIKQLLNWEPRHELSEYLSECYN